MGSAAATVVIGLAVAGLPSPVQPRAGSGAAGAEQPRHGHVDPGDIRVTAVRCEYRWLAA
jgi:hypothetical protein